MKLTLQEYKNISFTSYNNNIQLESYINEIFSKSIYDDEKINYIISANEFYDKLYDIMKDIYGINFLSQKGKF